jgi:5-methylcytosine-specific restriction enzyme subunit McrC
MKHKANLIQVFEHETLLLDQTYGDVKFDDDKHKAFVRFYGKGVPYFNLINKGIKFNAFVGTIQVGNTVVNVLPKADKQKQNEEAKDIWNSILLGMLRAVHGFDTKAPSSSQLKTRQNSVLDLYFELFVREVEYLLHRGLVKKYRKTEANLTALKGSLQFAQHISRNLVHKERFYTRHTVYDTEHLLHIILYQAILVIKRIHTNAALTGNINSLLLNFPEMPVQKITEAVFDKIKLNRKTEGYRKALDIARLILLNYHPDLSQGRKDVLALMFDMNNLWEQFVLVSLKKHKELKVRGQHSKHFWKPEGGYRRTIRPDISIEKDDKRYIIDTKWKLIDSQPSMDDLRQMYAYHHYFDAEKVALLYPGSTPFVKGIFAKTTQQDPKMIFECGLLFTKPPTNSAVNIKNWQIEIGETVDTWLKP